MIRKIMWSSMAWPAVLSIFGVPLFDSLEEIAEPLGWVAGLWAGTLLVCAAFWRFGWGRSAARQLYLWGFVGVIAGAIIVPVHFWAMVIANVLPIIPIGSWVIALYTTMGLGVGAGVTALHIGGRLRKEDYRR
jgi:hypothetical protein